MTFTHDGQTWKYREGQEFCYECGERFQPDSGQPTPECPDLVTVTCPNGCRGSWADSVEDIRYAVVYNRGENTTKIERVNMNDIFDSNNPDGWTFQDLGGSHGHCDLGMIFKKKVDAVEYASELKR